MCASVQKSDELRLMRLLTWNPYRGDYAAEGMERAERQVVRYALMRIFERCKLDVSTS